MASTVPNAYTSRHLQSVVRIQIFWKHRLVLARERLRRKELDDMQEREERQNFLVFKPSWSLLRRSEVLVAEVNAAPTTGAPLEVRDAHHRYPSEPSLSQASSSSPPPATPPANDETIMSISSAANVIKFFIRSRVWLRQLRRQRMQQDKHKEDEERARFQQYQPSPPMSVGGSRRARARDPDVAVPDSRSDSPQISSGPNAVMEPASLTESTIQAITEATAALIDGAVVSMIVDDMASEIESSAVQRVAISPTAGQPSFPQERIVAVEERAPPPPRDSENYDGTNREMTVDELPMAHSPPKRGVIPPAREVLHEISLLEDDEGAQRYEAEARSIAKLQILHRNFVEELLSMYRQQESSHRLSIHHMEAAGRTNIVELQHLAVAYGNARHLSATRIQCWFRSLRAKAVLRLRSARRTREVMQRIASELSTPQSVADMINGSAPATACPGGTTTAIEKSIFGSLEQQARLCAALTIQRCVRGHVGRREARRVAKECSAAMMFREQQEDEKEIATGNDDMFVVREQNDNTAAVRSDLEQQHEASEIGDAPLTVGHDNVTADAQSPARQPQTPVVAPRTADVCAGENTIHRPATVVSVDEATEASPTKSDGGCQTEPLSVEGYNGTTLLEGSNVAHANELVQTDVRTNVDASTQVNVENAPAVNTLSSIVAPPTSSQRPNSARVPSKPNQPPPTRRPTTAVAPRRSSSSTTRTQPYVDQSFDTSSILRSLAAVGVHRSSSRGASALHGNFVEVDDPLDVPNDDLIVYVAAESSPAQRSAHSSVETTHAQGSRSTRDSGRTLGYSGMLAKLKEVLEVTFEWTPAAVYGISYGDLLDSLYATLYPRSLSEMLDHTTHPNQSSVAEAGNSAPMLMLDVPLLDEGSPASPPTRNAGPLAALWQSEEFVARVIHHLSRLVVPEFDAQDHVYLFDEVALVILSAIPVYGDENSSGLEKGGDFGTSPQGLTADELGPHCDEQLFVQFCRALRSGMVLVAEERKAAGSSTIAATFSFLDVHRRRLVPRALFERVFPLRVALPQNAHPVAIPYLPFVEILRRNLIRSPPACQKQLGMFFEKILLAPSWVHVGGARRQTADRLESALRTHASDLLDAVQLIGARSGVQLHDSLALYSSLLPATSRRNVRWLCLAFLVSIQNLYGETVAEAFDQLADVVRRLAASNAPLEVHESQETMEDWMSIFRRLTHILESSPFEEALRIQRSCNGSATRQNVYRSPVSLTEEMDRCVPWSALDPAALDAAAFFASQHPTNFAPELTQMIPVTKHGFLTLDPSVVRRNSSALRAQLPSNSASTHVSNYDLRRGQLNQIFYALRHYLLTVNDISEFQFMNRLGAPGRKKVQTPKEAEAALVQFVQNLPSVSHSCPWSIVSRDGSRDSSSGAVFTERFSQMIFALSYAEHSQRHKTECTVGGQQDRATSNVSSSSSTTNSGPPTTQTPLTRQKSAARPSPTEICSPPSRQSVHSSSSSPKLVFKPPQQPFFRARQNPDAATTFSVNVPQSKTTSMETIMTTFRGVPVSSVTANRASELLEQNRDKTFSSCGTPRGASSEQAVARPAGVYSAFRSEYSTSRVAKTAVAVVAAQSNPRLQALLKK